MELLAMPTDKNKVSAYLSDQDFALLGELAAQHRVSKSQMVAIAIRSMSEGSTPTNTVTTPTDNVPVESGVSKAEVESLVESQLVELLSNPTEELKQKLEALFNEYVISNAKVELLQRTFQSSKVSEVTVKTHREENDSSVIVESPSNGSSVINPPTVTALESSDLTVELVKLSETENNSSSDTLEAPSNDSQNIYPIGEDKLNTEGIKGLTGTELAKKLGVRSEYLSRWKSGKSIPTKDSHNYQAYQGFLKYSYEKRNGEKKEKYYLISSR